MSILHCPVKVQTKCGQSHVNAGTVPSTRNAGTQGRPVAGLKIHKAFKAFVVLLKSDLSHILNKTCAMYVC